MLLHHSEPDRGRAGELLMRCPLCHRLEYRSEFHVRTRPDACRCRWCPDHRALLEPVLDVPERPADRFRSRTV